MKTLRYRGIYILKTSEVSCERWKQYFLDRGFDLMGFTVT